MLSTLLIPTAGVAEVDGFDVTKDEVEVRRRLGVLFGGDKGLYNQLSARENLRYFGHLYGMTSDLITERSDELLAKVGLSDRANERVESLLPWHEAAAAHRQDADPPTAGRDPRRADDRARPGGRPRGARTDRRPRARAHGHAVHPRHARGGRALRDGGDHRPRADRRRGHAGRAQGGRPGRPPGADQPQRRTARSRSRAKQQLSKTSRRHRLDRRGRRPRGERSWCAAPTSRWPSTSALAVLRGDGSQVRSIDVREPTLEDAFLGATGRDVRAGRRRGRCSHEPHPSPTTAPGVIETPLRPGAANCASSARPSGRSC